MESRRLWGRGGSSVLWVLLSVCVCASGVRATEIAPWQDDANLHDVQFVSSRVGFAVGDQGIVWKTADSGVTWQACPVPAPAMLRSVSFLTDRMGWVGGTLWQPYTRLAEGVVYVTTDGGATWKQCGAGQLPALQYLRCFSPEEGVAVGTGTALHPSGIYRTEDGGQTWNPVPSPSQQRWQAALFVDPELGIVADRSGKVALVGGDQLLASNLNARQSRSVRGLTLQPDDTAWLVGDGGLVMTSQSGGVSWAPPEAPLPLDVRHACDFRTVAAVDQQVWAAGSPGSVVWTSPDGGQSWERLLTNSPLPINKLVFVSRTAGIAVGELGIIRRTVDGGRTWQTMRGTGRRAAWLAFVPSPVAASLELGVKLSAEEGYRGVVWSASFPEAATADSSAADIRDRLAAAGHATRLNVAGVSWQLPVDRPDLMQTGDALLARWQVRSEQRAPELLVSELVRQLRTYQPDVVILPHVPEGDALASFILQAAEAALEQSADGTRAIPQRELAGLPPWSVSRVYRQLAAGSRGDVTWSPEEYLPRLGESLSQQTEPSATLLFDRDSRSQACAFRRVTTEPAEDVHVGGLFAGLEPSPGSATRRALLPIDEARLNAGQKRQQTLRNFRAFTDRALREQQTSAQLIGNLPEVLKDLNVDQAANVLSDLGWKFRRTSQFEHAEATYLELVRRHPDHPAALEGMTWLVQYWGSGELTYQRLRGTGRTTQRPRTDVEALQQRILQANAPGGAFLTEPRTAADIVPTSGTRINVPVTPQHRHDSGGAPDHVAAWQRRALELASQLHRQSPHLFQQPEVQLPLAALNRATKAPGKADAIYRQFQQGASQGPVADLMERELWVTQPLTLTPRQVAVCRQTSTRPQLDGILSDPCWQNATEHPFGPVGDTETAQPSGFVMFAYDAEFLYVAAVAKRVPERTINISPLGDRDYDADLRGFDRIGLAFDVDRDYVTWYGLEVDERGQTADRCWENARWNPKWYVARDADAERWQIELAIPWSELVAAAPQPRDIWAASILRTIPHVGSHGWGSATEWPPRWDSFGLLRFE